MLDRDDNRLLKACRDLNNQKDCHDSPYCQWTNLSCGKKTYGNDLENERKLSCDQKKIWKACLGSGVGIAVFIGSYNLATVIFILSLFESGLYG